MNEPRPMFNEGACAGGCGEVRDVGDFLYHDGEAYCEKCLPATILSEAGIEVPDWEWLTVKERLTAVCRLAADLSGHLEATEENERLANERNRESRDQLAAVTAERDELKAQLAAMTEERDCLTPIVDALLDSSLECLADKEWCGGGGPSCEEKPPYCDPTREYVARYRVQKEAGDE